MLGRSNVKHFGHLEKWSFRQVVIALKDLCNARALRFHSTQNHKPIKIDFKSCQIFNITASTSPDLSVLFTLKSFQSNFDFLNIVNSTFHRNANLSSLITVINLLVYLQ